MGKVTAVKAETVIPLRHSVLREGLPLSSAHFPLDEESLHWAYISDGDDMGLFHQAQVLSVATAHREPHSLGLVTQNPWRLRGMATHKAYQGQGLGQMVLARLLADLKELSVDLLWCNARLGAIGFYEKNGFRVESEIFEIPTAGPHRVMSKAL